MKRIDLADVQFNVWEAGDGPPLLLVHGFPLSHAMWRAQFGPLSACFRVIAPDLRGFGASQVTSGTVTMEQFADDCHALLEALDVREPVTFCGLSMGGYIAWQFARKYADRLARLIVCDTRALPDTPEAAETRLKMAEQVLSLGSELAAKAMLPRLLAPASAERRPELVDELRRMMLATDPVGIAAAQRGMAVRPDARSLLPAISAPTLVLVGEHDVISTPEEMRQIAAAIPRSKFVVVPGVGHMAPMEDPDTVNRALIEFVSSS
jgi:pimeloyl-ACP methyl ester carboxylesterase